jgi:hypothetical protein
MLDPSFAFSKAYSALLAGLVVDGQPVALFDQMADDNALGYYIILGPWIATSDNTKSSFGQKGEITLDCVTRFMGNQRSRKPVNAIAGAVLERIKPTVTSEVLDLTPDGFRCYLTVVSATQDALTSNKTDTVVRKLLTIEHRIEQIN